MAGGTDRAVSELRDLASDVWVDDLESIKSFYEYLRGVENAYSVQGRMHQIENIVHTVLEEFTEGMWREVAFLLMRRGMDRYVNYTNHVVLKLTLYFMYFFPDDPRRVVEYVAAYSTYSTATLAFSYSQMSWICPWLREYAAAARRMYREGIRYIPKREVKAYREIWLEEARRAEEEAYMRCIRMCEARIRAGKLPQGFNCERYCDEVVR